MTMPERTRMKVLREGLTFAFGFATGSVVVVTMLAMGMKC